MFGHLFYLELIDLIMFKIYLDRSRLDHMHSCTHTIPGWLWVDPYSGIRLHIPYIFVVSMGVLNICCYQSGVLLKISHCWQGGGKRGHF